jgi:hypothetical protein
MVFFCHCYSIIIINNPIIISFRLDYILPLLVYSGLLMLNRYFFLKASRFAWALLAVTTPFFKGTSICSL